MSYQRMVDPSTGAVRVQATPFAVSVQLVRPANTTAYTVGDIINSGPAVQAITTNGSKVITPASMAGLFTGMAVTGTGIAASTVIASVGTTTVTLDKNATASAVRQVETATAVGTITKAGNATVIVTADGMTGSPKTISVAVALDDTAAVWAGKVRTALAADAAVTALFTVGGTGAAITLTDAATMPKANDATLNISLDNDDCEGITTAAASADTTAGVVAPTLTFTATATLPWLDFSALGGFANQFIEVRSAIISSNNGGAATKLSAQVVFFKAGAMQANCADHAAFAPAYATVITNKSGGLDDVSTSLAQGATCYEVMQADVSRIIELGTGGKLYVAILAANAYTPASGEILTLTVQGIFH